MSEKYCLICKDRIIDEILFCKSYDSLADAQNYMRFMYNIINADDEGHEGGIEETRADYYNYDDIDLTWDIIKDNGMERFYCRAMAIWKDRYEDLQREEKRDSND